MRLLYDADTGKSAAGNESFMQRGIPRNPGNTRVPGGIENLLLESLFEERFYDVTERPQNDGGSTTIKKLRKEEFRRWVCEQRKDAADCAAFETLLVPILREFLGSPATTLT